MSEPTGVASAILSATMLAQTLRMSIPYACAALGGVWSERSGIVNVALEGILLAGGFAAVAVSHATGSALLGAIAGALTGAGFGAVHAVLSAYGRVNAIVSGIALNIIAAGGTRFLLRAFYSSSSNSPSVEGFASLGAEGSSGASLLVRTLVDPLTISAVFLVVLTALSLRRTSFGLRVRAAGEDPHAAASAGIDVPRVRLLAVSIGGAICGLGGVALAFDQHQFQSGMSGQRGYIALAAVILSGWRPAWAVIACVVFAALDALQIVLQGQVEISPYALQAIPFVATLVAMFAMGLRRGVLGGEPPAGLGKHAS